ncbi:catechol 2,3-dioxygenase [Heyndrickxia ginsengihumi]|uniref:Catechol 2,3-dioxygenase n=1 Tax=Heyndrickxia ginsengihumi TaxID=363870 RepID=A0A6M0P8E2_9BACI|nr:catechol 2,3-dioxygenase [Heyndrickxia ginsengihumi]MBE6184642.1 catechol 2,3-dioxygenase [Bacillus sp. (in: firmicutes)]NEY20821.1 catechol 2,3-dioxygenase [Heyndrickxia ginsengihumi]
MSSYEEPILDVAHLGHIELLTPKIEESVDFFKNVMGMEVVHQKKQSMYLRACRDYESYSLKLTESKEPGLGHMAMRTYSSKTLERRALAIEESGFGIGWSDGDFGHGKSYQFTDPDGHTMELYYETEKYNPPPHLVPALKNQPQKCTSRGVCVKQLDHINLFASDVDQNSQFMRKTLGCKLSEQIILDIGKQGGAWLHLTNKAYEIAYTLDSTGAKGRLHHITYNVDSREAVLQAADVFLENGVFIEFPPSKHAIQQTYAMYVYEPGGTRIEICHGGYSITAPDWEPITWTEAERAKGQAWGNKTVPTFHTYGTPNII